MPDPLALLVGLAASAVVAALILGLARLAGRPALGAALPAALALGYLAGHWSMARPKFPLEDVADRPFGVAMGALVLGLLGMAWPWGVGPRWLGRLAVVEATIAAMLGPVLGEGAEARPDLVGLLALGNASLIAWGALIALADRGRPAQAWPTLVLLAGASGVVLIGSGSVVLGQLGLCLMAALVGAAAVAWGVLGAGSALALARGGAGVFVAIEAALLISGHYYAEVKLDTLALLASTPVAAWIGCVLSRKVGKPWQGTLITLAMAVVPLAVAVGLVAARALAVSAAGE